MCYMNTFTPRVKPQIMKYSRVLTLESADEIIKCDHSSESY